MTYGIRALCRLPSHPLLFPLKSLSISVIFFKSGIFFADILINKNITIRKITFFLD